jgi:hypothetical protein
MLRSLKEVQADDSVIGFYQATTLGAFLNQTLVDTQAIHQDKLRHGGIVIVHGEYAAGERSCRILIYPYRPVTNCTRECFVPGLPINTSILGCVQKIKLQHLKVRVVRN